MSDDWVRDIVEFHYIIKSPVLTEPKVPPADRVELREKLLREEFGETLEALQAGDLVELADGLADLIVVAIGTALEHGIDLRPVWDEVHRSNMAKKGGPIREDGKQLKPKGWVPPQIEKVLQQQRGKGRTKKAESQIRKEDTQKVVDSSKIDRRIRVIFDGPPGHNPGRFVDVENHEGKSINAGDWVQRCNYWELRINNPDSEYIRNLEDENAQLRECLVQRDELCKQQGM